MNVPAITQPLGSTQDVNGLPYVVVQVRGLVEGPHVGMRLQLPHPTTGEGVEESVVVVPEFGSWLRALPAGSHQSLVSSTSGYRLALARPTAVNGRSAAHVLVPGPAYGHATGGASVCILLPTTGPYASAAYVALLQRLVALDLADPTAPMQCPMTMSCHDGKE